MTLETVSTATLDYVERALRRLREEYLNEADPLSLAGVARNLEDDNCILWADAALARLRAERKADE